MDLYPYLNFFQDYQYEQGYYTPLNDLDLIMDIDSEEDKPILAYTFLGEIESTFSSLFYGIVRHFIDYDDTSTSSSDYRAKMRRNFNLHN